MKMVDFTIDEEHILKHKNRPVINSPHYKVREEKMPDLYWIKVTSLGFGRENQDKDNNVFYEGDKAARLLAASGVPFSLLCERLSTDNSIDAKGTKSHTDKIVFAIGVEKEHMASSILQAAFGTVAYEVYVPASQWESGVFADCFEAIRSDLDFFEKRESVNSFHISSWVDEVARILMYQSGMVRIDFHPVSENLCDNAKKISMEIQDEISAYLETNTSVSNSISYDPKDNIVRGTVNNIKGEKDKYNHSSDGSISWKNTDVDMDLWKEELNYYTRLLNLVGKDGWSVSFSVSADIGIGKTSSKTKEDWESNLIVPISEMIVASGYTCTWNKYIDGTKEYNNNNYYLKHPVLHGMVVTTPNLIDYISFPTTSFYGFERVINRYYNLNFKESDSEVPLAQLLQFANNTGIEVSLPQDQINRHIFVCGMTGSGKTNTVHQLLSKIGNVPFLVIEPVKGEYFSLPGVKTYTMTAGSNQALCFNPFWFPCGSNLQYHIDCLRQIISSAFDLYAAMPNILEQCLSNVYQHCGWDIVKGRNFYSSELPEQLLYPTFGDLCQEVENYINTSKFGEETKANYRGALLSRLQSFTSGSKGMLLNTTSNIAYETFENEKIVISLDSLADDADKSIVMGAILAQYYEFLKINCRDCKRKGLKHIVVIEEAHHLFAADVSSSNSCAEGGSGQNSSQTFVKTLNNMLAEIRAYGEGFIIVDQSPSALHPAVLKNTGVKIVHRIDYGEDIDTIQDVLLLDDEDNELATLIPGQALLRFGGMKSPAKVYIPRCETKENSAIIPSEEISGDSLLSHLLEDRNLRVSILPIVERLLNHILYDNLSNYQKFYEKLCFNIDREMVLFGHNEIVVGKNHNNTLIKYVESVIPSVTDKILPNQYGTAKMIEFFISRFLDLVDETESQLSKLEILAFEGYRERRIWSRISQRLRFSKVKVIEDTISILKDILPETELIINIAQYMIKNEIPVEERKDAFDELLSKCYFFDLPSKHEILFSSVDCLLEYYRKQKV